MLTPRLEVRHPRESDRSRFVELFANEAFMAYSDGVLAPEAANDRFDEMLVRARELTFAKQPVIERLSGFTIGYAGVNWFPFEGRPVLEFGWRLVPEARGRGYATEASRAVLGRAAESYSGEIISMIDPANAPSRNVAEKLGFEFWKQAPVDGYVVDIHRLTIGSGLTSAARPTRGSGSRS